jgi:hypothetical protein
MGDKLDARPLPYTGQHKINVDEHLCFEEDSNP